MNKSLLIIFAKNPILGKVKTRLAATIGDDQALAIYYFLLSHTIEVTADLKVDKAVFYSDFIDTEDKWSNSVYEKFVQVGKDLGERMHHAFKTGFEMGYSSICIIGSDNLEISSSIIKEGFKVLNEDDVVIGPAKDGGYYLLGMKKLYSKFFREKEWSTNSVYSSTIKDVKKLQLKYFLLPTLNDIDTKEDWERAISSK